MAKGRADQVLVARGFFASRAKAQAAIAAGLVAADGRLVMKAGEMIAEDAEIQARSAFDYVSRGGLKLAFALDHFGVDPAGRVCLDLGASTGGFTDVLLRRSAAQVIAVDVGAGQFAPALASDPRVRVHQGLDARRLSVAHLDGAQPSLIVVDVSFIGLAKLLPAPLKLAAAQADLVALIKPQYEAGPGRLEPAETEAVARAAAAGLDGLEGFAASGFVASPIRGGEGQQEYFYFAQRRTPHSQA